MDRAGKEFGTKIRKVGGFSHEEIQHHYNTTKNIQSFFHENSCKNGKLEEVGYGETLKVSWGSSDGFDKFKEWIHGFGAREMCRCKKYGELVVYNMS